MGETQVETKWKRKNKIRFHRFPQDAPETQFWGVKFFFVFPKWKRIGNELVKMETNWKRTRKSGNEWKRTGNEPVKVETSGNEWKRTPKSGNEWKRTGNEPVKVETNGNERTAQKKRASQ